EMLRAANLLVGKAPKSPAALTLKGRAHIYLKQKAEAVEALQGALRANKSYRPAYEALLSLYSDNFSEKRIIYQDMLASFGRKPDLLKELCDLETDDGDNDAALKICSEAAKADPSNPLPSINIARVKFRTENREEGEKLLANISKQHPSSEVAQFFYAKNLLEQKRYLDAFTKFQDCLRVDRKSDRCWAGLGETAVQIEKHQVAHDAFRNACEINGSWSLEVRRAAQVLRKAKQLAWESRFMALAEACSQRGSR
ncbi:MAG: tetratricopeptide repeat protein, partial [Bdellovibrionaceae bacterium]|nr:tetratricopeptide repeat protein [Pseudobdellovibrionaceae bacterium]